MYTGRKLFPDPNQIYRIRQVVKNIINEVSDRLGRKISQTEFVTIVNNELRAKKFPEDSLLNLAIVNRLSLFGKHSAAANSLKLLESLPLLHVVSERYSEDDLKRVALGQNLNGADEVLINKLTLRRLRQQLLSAMSVIDELTGDKYVASYRYDIDLTEDKKRYIFNQIIAYKQNLREVLESGLLTEQEFRAYQEDDIPDYVIIALLANLELPGPVLLLLQKESGDFGELVNNHNPF